VLVCIDVVDKVEVSVVKSVVVVFSVVVVVEEESVELGSVGVPVVVDKLEL
jgi:hypothetical protein